MKSPVSPLWPLAGLLGFVLAGPALAGAGELAAMTAARAGQGALTAYDGVVEAVRQSVLAAQVNAAVVELKVKVGDRVAAGQVLMRLDARAAEQTAAAGDAQWSAARAAQDVAAKELLRQKELAASRFISAAALDRAEAEFKAAQAQSAAQMAQAGAVRTQSGFYVVRAPYAAVVSEVPITLGEMALPGRALVTLYDPAALRVSSAVPQSALLAMGDGQAVRLEVPSLPAALQGLHKPVRVQVLPAADLATHTVTLRADLAGSLIGVSGVSGVNGLSGLSGLMPGQFARLWLPTRESAGGASPWVPLQAIVRRAEVTGLYVLDGKGLPLLRQVRLGRSDGAQVEVLSGLSLGERVATDAQLATRRSASAP